MMQQVTMLDYIKETPQGMEANMRNRIALVKPLLALYSAKPYPAITIVASGSSYNAAACAKTFIEQFLQTKVTLVTPASYIYHDYRVLKDDFTFVISQSGCSTNALAALKKLKELKIPAIGVTANSTSDFLEEADILINYGAGEEKVGFVTKGVVTLCLFLILFALEAASALGKLEKTEYQRLLKEIALLPDYHRRVQELTARFYQENKAELTALTTVYFIGFKQALGVCDEAALKCNETIKVPCFALEAEEFLHGPNLQLTPNYTVFAVDDFTDGSKRIKEIYAAVKKVTKRSYLLTAAYPTDDPQVINLPFKPLEPTLSPLYLLPFYEMIAYQVTEDLHRWQRHPLLADFAATVKTKTAKVKNFVNS